jgi:hypothetical protein
MQRHTGAMIKELYVGLIGWAWIVTFVAAFYFLVMAIFNHGSWWHFFGSVAVSVLLYRVSLYYQLEKERAWRRTGRGKFAAVSEGSSGYVFGRDYKVSLRRIIIPLPVPNDLDAETIGVSVRAASLNGERQFARHSPFNIERE